MNQIESSRHENFNGNLMDSLLTIKELAQSHLDTVADFQAPSAADGGVLLERANTAIFKALEQANKVIQMIQHFRTMVYSDPVRVNGREATSVQDSVGVVMHAMQYECPFRKITVLKIIPHDLKPVRINRDHFEAMLFHLIYNARQAIGAAAGIITIEAQEKVYATPENKNRSRFALRIGDTGSGIPGKDLPHIFDPFFGPSGDDEGKGLRLFLVKKLVELYAGSIRVDTANTGTSFRLEFPV